MATRKLGILTGGGDCPGLNAVIRGAVLSAKARGWEVLGIRVGYQHARTLYMTSRIDAAEQRAGRARHLLSSVGVRLGLGVVHAVTVGRCGSVPSAIHDGRGSASDRGGSASIERDGARRVPDR